MLKSHVGLGVMKLQVSHRVRNNPSTPLIYGMLSVAGVSPMSPMIALCSVLLCPSQGTGVMSSSGVCD